VACVKVESVSKYFGDFAAVDDVTAEFKEGTVTVLLGPSGCGKTTLMRMIVGLEQPTSGRVLVGDVDVTKTPTRKRDIGMVFQYPVIYRGTTVARNLELPLKAAGMNPAVRKKRIEETAELIGIENLLESNVDTLGNAGRQKVAMARELARQPEVLLFDEPITNVDLASKLELKRSLKRLFTEYKQTIIYVTHDQTEAMSFADNIALMDKARIVQFDKPRAIYDDPNNAFAGWFLGSPGMNFIERAISVSGTEVKSPLLKKKIAVRSASNNPTTLGIRPERVEASLKEKPGYLKARVFEKALTIGGRFMLDLEVDDLTFKAIVAHDLGKEASEAIWVNLPEASVRLFDQNGNKVPIKTAD
jgi:ABC-type sugar transport system ATPase subunit